MEVRQSGYGGIGPQAHLRHRRHSADGVIDVVHGRQIHCHHVLLAPDIHHQLTAVGPLTENIRHGVVRPVPPVAALGAAEAAQVAIADVVVFIFRLTADAVGGVRNLRLGPGGGRPLLNTEPDHLIGQVSGQRSGEGAVRIQTELCLRHALHGKADIFQGVGHFAVAVQLIPEQVGHHHHLGLQLGEDAPGSRLVAFNDGVFLPAFAGEAAVHDKLRGDAADQIGPGAVGKIALPLLQESLLHHAGAGGLAVGAGDGHSFDPGGHDGKQLGTKLQGNTAGHGGAAPVQQPGNQAQQFAEKDGKKSVQVHDNLSRAVKGL